MKVLLCQDVKRLGWFGDVLEVSDGYARNYLLPQGLAIVPTESNLKSLAKEKGSRAEQRILERGQLEAAAAAVEGAEAVVAAKANVLGHLFGSVGVREIAANLQEQGFEVAESIVELPENIKEVGTSEVTLKFAEDLTATVSVVVVATGEDITSGSPQGGVSLKGPKPIRGPNGKVSKGSEQEEISEPTDQDK